MSHKVPWPQPYPGITTLPHDQTVRLTVHILKSDMDAILRVTFNSSAVINLCQAAVKSTANVCREHFLQYDPDFSRFCEYLRDRTYSGFVAETTQPNVGGGTPSVLPGTQAGVDESTKPGEGASSGSSREGRKGKIKDGVGRLRERARKEGVVG